MKKFSRRLAVCLALAATSLVATAQSAIYRCGNEYLNDAALAVARGCQVVEGGNVTLVPGTRVDPAVVSTPAHNARRGTDTTPGSTTNAAAQRARDSDARSILLAELITAETRLADQQREYNNGQPEMLGTETRDPQRYQHRVNELKEGVNRFLADIAGLKREIARLPTAVLMPSQSAP
jgi:hypothetical protein